VRRAACLLIVAGLAAGVVVPPITATAASPTPPFFAGCAAPGESPSVAVGKVSCQELASPALGGTTAFSYFVPPACAPASGRRCPVLYLLHGFGGDYTSMLGTADHPSAWVAAVSSGPPIDPHTVADPWNYSDPAHWVPRPALDLILVAPDGRTVPGGYGPAPGVDGFWVDWNPRYAASGGEPRYHTRAPGFATDVVDEILPYVESHLPTRSGREWRALAGTSLGGYGSYQIGLTHPDLWSSLGSVSGALNLLLLPGADPTGVRSPAAVQPPGAMPYHPLPGAVGVLPGSLGQAQAEDFNATTLALGDPVADQAYYRGRNPRDLALNAGAFRAGRQVTELRGFSNDAVPRRSDDLASPPDYLIAQTFEALVLDMNVDFQSALPDVGVSDHYELHPGIHSDPYWNPWLRGQLENQYASLRHPGGGGSPPPPPDRFDYRTVARSFSVWGWRFDVSRPTDEFLELRDVTCRSLTLRGSGKVTLEVPAFCGTGTNGSRLVHVDLGPSMPTDAPAGADATPAYGRSVTVELAPLHGGH
jgi:S-formylglutathione hydrolase FrmB